MASNDFASVAMQFVQHYYNTFDTNRNGLAPLYGEASMLTFEDAQFKGVQQIMQKLNSLQFQQIRHQVIKVDSQPSVNNGILVFVTGTLMVDNEANPLKFAQVFHLQPNAQGGGYYCFNDLFRLNIG
ncbi:unnamed protein product [Vitrella brassicaformis CCMP3155]|uniref:Nuclear transport factor 2 n=1 Tax=Vitrella brassicaformis (strain CCMP3155) TaxID=1169540 RepID=A0A0G4FJT1_VITBC|nr:unnamed protein product [Vitrella brassicaformis CCMP3155]|eukprot:CEM14027.1 unnamed protein product [Vitrella brassicaformis CCMP3155]